MKLRPVLFWLHLGTGISVGTVVFVMAVTGILISFEPQIVEYAERDVRKIALPAEGAQRLSAGALIAAASAGKGSKASGLSQSADPEASATVFFGKQGAVFVNPYTGQVLGGLSPVHDFMHKVIEIHRWLGSRKAGKPVANACNAALFVMLLSGLFLWWPRQWNASVRKAILFFNPALRGKARDWNWHNAVGIWVLPLLLITTLTGMVMSYSWANRLLFYVMASQPPRAEVARGNPEADKSRPQAVADFDKLWARAASQVQGWESIALRVSRDPGGKVTASIVEPGARTFMRSQLTMYPETGEVVNWEPFESQSSGKRARAWMVPLHTGQAWGVPGQVLAMLGAVGAGVLIWTGFSLSWRRFFSSRSNKLSL